MEKKVLFCTCNHVEHQIILIKDKEDDEVYFTYHLSQKGNIFKRIITAVKYVFGFRSKFGDFGEVILDRKTQDELIDYLKK